MKPNDYEKLLKQQINDAKQNVEYYQRKYDEAKEVYSSLEKMHDKFVNEQKTL